MYHHNLHESSVGLSLSAAMFGTAFRQTRILSGLRQQFLCYYPSRPAPFPSTHPMGINAAATSPTPLSIASRLNCDAAFRVSKISTRSPSSPMRCRVSGLRGRIVGPVPMTSRSVKSDSLARQPSAPVFVSRQGMIGEGNVETHQVAATPVPAQKTPPPGDPTALARCTAAASCSYRMCPSPLAQPRAAMRTPRPQRARRRRRRESIVRCSGETHRAGWLRCWSRVRVSRRGRRAPRCRRGFSLPTWR